MTKQQTLKTMPDSRVLTAAELAQAGGGRQGDELDPVPPTTGGILIVKGG